MSAPISLPRAYALVLSVIERTCWNWKAEAPWLHAGTMASRMLRSSPALWRIYKAGISAGYASEFQRPKVARTERERHWQRLEQAARRLVATSAEPMTLREAVLGLLKTPEGRRLYQRYAETPARRPPCRVRRR